jgi:hypothetical protein
MFILRVFRLEVFDCAGLSGMLAKAMSNRFFKAMFHHLTARVVLSLIVLMSCVSAGFAAEDSGDRAQKAGLVPHKALYDIKLVATRSGSQIVNIGGKMLYEWQSACEAWTSDHRFDLYYEYADSPSMRITSDFTTYETFDGKSMSFTSQRKRDDQMFSVFRGHASLDDQGQGSANYTVPEGLSFTLPDGTLFPMAHTLEVLKKIEQGERFFSATIFDGSDDEGPVEVNAFIGNPVELDGEYAEVKSVEQDLLKSPARQVRLAFFPLKDETETADYEMTITLHENGVISDMLVEYDDFTVEQRLLALESLVKPCEDVGFTGTPNEDWTKPEE